MPLLAAIVTGQLVLAPMVLNGALNAIQTQGPKRLDIAYEAIVPVPVLGRLKAATASISADLSPTSYVIRSRAEAAGFVDWFVDYNLFITATGSVGPQGLRPARYVSSNKDGKKNRQVTVDFTSADVTTNAVPRFGDLGHPPASLQQRLEAMDPLSAIVDLALGTQATASNPCGGPIRAFDGKQRFDLVLTYAGRLNYESSAYTGPAIKCELTYVELAGFKDKDDKQKAKDQGDIMWSNMILAELDGATVRPPIKIEARSKKRGKMTVQATRVSYGPAPVHAPAK